MRPLHAFLLAVSLCGCTSTAPDLEPDGRGVLHLDAAFSARPWAATRGPARPGPVELRATFSLSPEWVGAGSALELEGLWWRAEGTLNSKPLAPVTGGNAIAMMPVGHALQAGDNQLVLRLTPPSGEMPLQTGGGLASSSFRADTATLLVAPRLVLRPKAHVAWATLRVEGDQVMPVARVDGAPAGATVRFSVVTDSGSEHAVGTALVGPDGLAQGAPADWTLDRWAPGDPALYPLQAALVSSSDATLDQLTTRIGVRSVAIDDGQIAINGAPHRLVGARVTNRPDLGTMPDRLAALLPAGVNALEIHGELPRTSWLDLADEVGLPVVFVPRCVGRTRRGSTPSASVLALQQTQDHRFMADLADRPSVLLWVGEGPSPKSQRNQSVPLVMWTDQLLQDPLQRPIVQHHLPDRFLQTRQPGADGVVHHSCEREPCEGAWIVEVTWDGPTIPAMWPAMATAFEQSIGVGAVGGVVPTPERHDVTNWSAAFQPMTSALAVPPLDLSSHPAPAIVAVSGGSPGATVWLSAAGAPTVGAVVAADGTASLSAWHDGAATLSVGSVTRSLDLDFGEWNRLVRSGGVTTVDLAGR